MKSLPLLRHAVPFALLLASLTVAVAGDEPTPAPPGETRSEYADD